MAKALPLKQLDAGSMPAGPTKQIKYMQSTISGYELKAQHKGISYTLRTAEGFRGINIPCQVWYDEGWHVTVQGRNIPVKYAVANLPHGTTTDAEYKKYNDLLADHVDTLIEYQPCDCGCPMQRSPATSRDVKLMRLASALRIGP